MSGIRVITEQGAVDVPIEVELDGAAAVDAYVAAQLSPATPSAPKPPAPPLLLDED